MLTPDEVVLAYRLILGREPESPDVVNNHCQNIHSVYHLREEFFSSAEFRRHMEEVLDKPQFIRHRHPFTNPAIPVEVSVSEEVLDRMFERIHQEWEYLGETDPYWSVVTQPQYHLQDFAEYRNQFYDSGKYIADIFLSALRRNHINHNHLEVCLDVGCGVGRVTNYLARAFQRVIGLDISAHHLELARKHLAEEGLDHVEFKQLERIHALDQLPQVDAVFSVITLQHNPPPIMAWMLKALLGRLKPGGVAFIQLPTYRNGYLFEVERYLNSETPKGGLEMHFLPQPEVFKIVRDAGCVCLEVREDGMIGSEDKMLSNNFLIQKA